MIIVNIVIQTAMEVEKMNKRMKIIIENNGKRVSLQKGSESIWMDIKGNNVHISATHRNGGYSVAELKFLKDEVEMIKSFG